jgi:hypothetical protein
VELLKKKLSLTPREVPTTQEQFHSKTEGDEASGSGNPITVSIPPSRQSADILTKLMAVIGQNAPPQPPSDQSEDSDEDTLQAATPPPVRLTPPPVRTTPPPIRTTTSY